MATIAAAVARISQRRSPSVCSRTRSRSRRSADLRSEDAGGRKPSVGVTERRHNSEMQVPRFWIAMQVVIVICVVISMVIAIIKL
jgi:hypothetical protein